MRNWCASSSKKGQMKIQQMAFVLVALFIFFVMAGLFYLTIRLSGFESRASSLGDEQSIELVRKLATSPEFAFTVSSCTSCIDLDKVLFLKEIDDLDELWDLDYLQVELILKEGSECNKFSFPECKTITIINNEVDFGKVVSSYVSLCTYQNADLGGYFKCEVGKIHASGENIG